MICLQYTGVRCIWQGGETVGDLLLASAILFCMV